MSGERTNCTVLAAEDDELVLALMRAVLSDLGMQVFAAASGTEAVALSQWWTGRIDLVLADVVMPGLGGRDVGETIRVSRPDVRLVLVSGYSLEVIERHGGLPLGSALLQKPFSVADLKSVVLDSLASNPGFHGF